MRARERDRPEELALHEGADLLLQRAPGGKGNSPDSGRSSSGMVWRLDPVSDAARGIPSIGDGVVPGDADISAGALATRVGELALPQTGDTSLHPSFPESDRDHCELERLEQLIQKIIEALPQGLLAFDEKGIISHWSGGAEEILGWERGEVIGRPVTAFLRAGGEEAALLADLVSRNGGTRELEITLRGKNDEPGLVSLTVSALASSEEGSHGAVVLLTDLAKQRRLEEQIRRRDRLASVGELSAGVAHEIRNPLAGIGTTAELLRSRLPGDAPETEFVDVILEEVGRLDKIISDLLSFARPRKPQPVRTDVHRHLDRMLLLLRRQLEERGIQVKRNYDRSLPSVMLDPGQTLQLFLNVGLNAVEAMDQGGCLTLTTRRRETLHSVRSHPGEWLRVEIQDTGAGVSAEHLEKVFNPFFTTKGKGSGLGLAICQRIVEEQGGEIYLESSPPHPTVAVIDFPLRSQDALPTNQTELFVRPGGETG